MAERPIDRVLAAQDGQRKSTTIEEFGDLKVWASPVTNQDRIDVHEQMRVRYGEDRESWPPVATVFMIAQKLEDEAGKRLFDWDDVGILLRKVDADALDRIAMWMYTTGPEQPLTLDEAKKE